MRPSAGAAIQILDRDDANDAFAFGGFAQSEIFGGIPKGDGDRTIFKYDLVRAAFGLTDLLPASSARPTSMVLDSDPR